MDFNFKHFLLGIFVFLPFCLHGASNNLATNQQGIVIILNGPSAAGKSSIQNEIQKQSPALYLKVGIYNFFDALLPTPDLSSFEKTKELKQFTNDGIFIRGIQLKTDPEGHQIVPLEIGPAGDKVISGMHSAIAAYASKGNNEIVDYILYKPEWLPDLVQALKSTKVYLIGIKAPLSVLEDREKKRGTSPVGHARSHYYQVHQGMIYDLDLDVSNLLPEQSAQKILEFVKTHPNPTAMQQLSQKLSTSKP
jgi:chloramphenicol 3-O phosphotransferase